MDRTPLDEAARQQLTADFPEWDVGADAMERTFVFDDFSASMGFVTRVALAAERLDHHPDVDIRWNKVRLSLSTHSAGGLTALDRELAGIAQELV